MDEEYRTGKEIANILFILMSVDKNLKKKKKIYIVWLGVRPYTRKSQIFRLVGESHIYSNSQFGNAVLCSRSLIISGMRIW